MYFQEDDLFLINRDSVSSTMKAGTIKDIVNPVGTVETPVIKYPTEQQGFPVNSSPIKRNPGAEGDTTVTLELDNHNNLDLLGGLGDPISELIESTDPYIPVTTQINIVSDLGSNKYELFFDAINYDLNLFKVGETVTSLKGKTATIDSIDPAINSCVITSSVDWGDEVDGRFLSSNEYTASGTLTRYYKNGNKFMADITGSTGYWIDSYNNRRQKMTFDTRFPKGGSHVDLNASTFVASPLVVDNSVLYLTKVLWRVNGVEFDVPVTDPLENKSGMSHLVL